MRKFRFYKESDGRWYVDLPEWPGSKADLEMVAGADAMLDYMAEGGNEVRLYISEKEFEGGDCLRLEGKAEDIGSGAYYFFHKYRGIHIDLRIWLCDVVLWVYEGKFPDKLFTSVI
jgi:hypothetical protein